MRNIKDRLDRLEAQQPVLGRVNWANAMRRREDIVQDPDDPIDWDSLFGRRNDPDPIELRIKRAEQGLE